MTYTQRKGDVLDRSFNAPIQEFRSIYATTNPNVAQWRALRMQDLIRQGEAALIALYKLTSHKRGNQPSKAPNQVRQRSTISQNTDISREFVGDALHPEII